VTVTLPITCRQLGYLILVGIFVVGNAVLMPINYGIGSGQALLGWVMVILSVIFGFIAMVIYIDDNKLIRCKCDKK